ncbi:MAG TPA: M14 family metallopeptidase [Chthoniobacteraceae bacterium]|nr:M14 family metallopeptidase [Chthoniobacteraceae bacterium]
MASKSLTQFRARVLPDSSVLLCAYLGAEAFKNRESAPPPVFRLYRRHEPDFLFNRDYADFFDGLSWTGADLLFEGEAALLNERKWEYRDTTAQIGQTYAYWATLKGSETPPAGPCAVKVRHPEVWWPYAKLEERLNRLAQRHPDAVTLTSHGSSTRQRPIPGITIGRQPPEIALVGAVHPGESGPELIVPVLEQLLEHERPLLEKVGLAALPSVSLDERERQVEGCPHYLRTNANGVDLNRNFPAEWETIEYGYGLISSDRDAVTYRGPFAASENETRTVMAFMETHRPKAVFSFHCLAGICSPVFLTTRSGADHPVFQEACEAWTRPYAEGYYGQMREPAVKYACSAGSLPHWLYLQSGVPCFDLEWDGDAATKGCINDLTTPEMIDDCARRHFEGIRAVLQSRLR